MPNTDPVIVGDITGNLNSNGTLINNHDDETDLTNFLAGTYESQVPPVFPATHFSIIVSGPLTAGSAYSVTVTALDAFNHIAISYAGTVHFTKSDSTSGTVVPGDYTFVSGDDGVHAFTGTLTDSIVLKTAETRPLPSPTPLTPALQAMGPSVSMRPLSPAFWCKRLQR